MQRIQSPWLFVALAVGFVGYATWAAWYANLMGRSGLPPVPRLTVNASCNPLAQSFATDGKNSTRWDSGRYMVGNETLTFNLGEIQEVHGVTLDAAASPGDHARGVRIEISTDGAAFHEVLNQPTAPAIDVQTYTFPKPELAQFVRVLQTGQAPTRYWSVNEATFETRRVVQPIILPARWGDYGGLLSIPFILWGMWVGLRTLLRRIFPRGFGVGVLARTVSQPRFVWSSGLSLLVTALSYHCFVPFRKSPSNAWTGIAIIFVSWAWLYAVQIDQRPSAKPDRGGLPLLTPLERLLAGAFALIAALIYFRHLTVVPIWTSEAFIVKDALNILAGTLIHPIGTNGDFPSNFMSWPVALMLFLTRDAKLAVRLVNLVCLMGAIIFLVKILWSISKGVYVGLACFLFVYCYWVLHLCEMGDNNWLSAIPLFILAQIYYLLRAIESPSRQSLARLGFVAGLSLWTLYMPFVCATFLMTYVMCLPVRIISGRGKAFVLLCCLVIGAPVIGSVLSDPSSGLARHRQYLLKYGEGAVPGTFLEAYFSTTARLLSHFWPGLNEARMAARGLMLEPTTLCLFLVGLVYGVISLPGRVACALVILFVLACAGIVVSNPVVSVWRETTLLPFVFIFAGLGCAAVIEVAKGSIGPRGVAVVLVLLATTHAAIFFSSFEDYRRFTFHNTPGPWMADTIYAMVSATHRGPGTLYVPPMVDLQLLEALSLRKLNLENYSDLRNVNIVNASPQSPVYLVVVDDATESDTSWTREYMRTLEDHVPTMRTMSSDGRFDVVLFLITGGIGSDTVPR